MSSKYLTEDNYYDIAKIISNDVNGSRKTFKAIPQKGYYLLTTNKCDFAPFIRVYTDGVSIDRIKVNGDYTDGYQDLHPTTVDNINKYLAKNNLELYNP